MSQQTHHVQYIPDWIIALHISTPYHVFTHTLLHFHILVYTCFWVYKPILHTNTHAHLHHTLTQHKPHKPQQPSPTPYWHHPWYTSQSQHIFTQHTIFISLTCFFFVVGCHLCESHNNHYQIYRLFINTQIHIIILTTHTYRYIITIHSEWHYYMHIWLINMTQLFNTQYSHMTNTHTTCHFKLTQPPQPHTCNVSTQHHHTQS